jgi:hypothetical protein
MPKAGSGSPNSPRPTISADSGPAGLGTNPAVPPRSSSLPPFRPLASRDRRARARRLHGCSPGSTHWTRPAASTPLGHPPASVRWAFQDRRDVKGSPPNSYTHTCTGSAESPRQPASGRLLGTRGIGETRKRRIQAGPGGPATSIVILWVAPGRKGTAPTCRRLGFADLDCPGCPWARNSRNWLVWTLLWTSLWTSTTDSGVHDNHLPHTPSIRRAPRLQRGRGRRDARDLPRLRLRAGGPGRTPRDQARASALGSEGRPLGSGRPVRG